MTSETTSGDVVMLGSQMPFNRPLTRAFSFGAEGGAPSAWRETSVAAGTGGWRRYVASPFNPRVVGYFEKA